MTGTTTQSTTTNISTTVNALTNASPNAIAAVVTNGIKYGTVATLPLAQRGARVDI